jgi:hypothetical protein
MNNSYSMIIKNKNKLNKTKVNSIYADIHIL